MEKIITKNLLPGRSYRVRATGVDSDGKTITSQVYILKTKGKSQAPPNVSNLSADFKGKTLVVTWNGDAARAEKDFKHFRIKLTSTNHPGITKNYYTDSNVFKFQEDQNRDAFGDFEGTISITVYSIDRTGNQSSGVSVVAISEPPAVPTNVKLSAAVLGYNVSWDFPTFANYKETRIYQSSTQNGTYTLAHVGYGSNAFVSTGSLSEKWVKVAHVNLAGIESEKVASVPPNIIPIDPVPTDVTPPAEPTNLNWEDAGLDTTNGITTANMRAHWEVSEITSGYKVRVTEDVTNKENWAVYDVPASRATVTNKSISGGVATLTVTAHSFATDDYVTVFNLGSPFDGKKKITSVTTDTLSFAVTGGDLTQTADPGNVVISSYTVKGLTPGKQHYGAILAYDSANNLTQFVSEGTFTTSGTPGSVGSAITIPGTTMAFGPNAGGIGKTGLHINSSNYWYNTGLFNVGTSGNSVSWDGVRLRLDGSIIARGGAFTGNVFLSSQKSAVSVTSGSRTSNIITLTTSIDHGFNPGDKVNISGTPTAYTGNDFVVLDVPTTTTFTYEKTGTNISQQSTSLQATLVSPDTTSSLIAAEYYNIQSATYSSGVGTIILSETPSDWVVGNSILVSLTSSIFDGQYVITSITGSTITFKMSPSVGSPSPVTNAGRVANLSAGDRVIFSSSGIQALEGNDVIFSINRSRSHKIGGFNIKPAKIDAGSGNNSITIASSGTYRLWAGADQPENAPFRLSGNGNIRAYGLFSSLDNDSGTRVSIGSDVSGSKDGIILDDISEPGNQNFWYIPSGVTNGNKFFQVGTLDGSAISVKKDATTGLPKVEIKDYHIVGVAKIIDQSSISIIGASEAIDLIKIGKNVDPRTGYGGRDGISINTNNFWTLNNSGSNVNFRVGDTSSNYLYWDGSALTISGQINVLPGGNAATTSQLSLKADNSGSAILSLIQDSASGGMTGVQLNSSGYIRSLNKTYGSSINGWILEYNASPINPRFDIGNGNKYLRWDGSQLLINGKVLGGSELGNNTGINIVDTDGININNTVVITSQYNAGSILFYNPAASNEDRLKGALFDSQTNKNAVTSTGRGIAMGSTGYYPFIEAGYASNTGTSNPRIRLNASLNSYLQMNASNFTLSGADSSTIIVADGTSPVKYLAKNSSNYLRWVDPPSFSGGNANSRVVSSLPPASSVLDGEIVMVV